MDPQKLPDANRPTPTNNPPSPSDAANDVSLSEESSVAPGTVVVGGEPSFDSASSDNKVPTPSSEATPVPSPNPSEMNSTEPDPQMAAFMRGDAPNDAPPAQGKKKIGLIIGIVIAVLLLLGGGVAAYFAFLKPNPDKILQQALVNTFSKDKVTSVAFDGGVVVTDQESSLDVSFDFDGSTDQDGQFNMSAVLAIPTVEPMTLDMLSADGKDFYIRVGGLASVLPLLGADAATASYVPLLQTIDNQWYELGQETLSQFAGDTLPTTSTGLSDADRQKLADAYTQNAFLTVTETLEDQKVAGVDSYHYKVQVDGNKLKAFLSAIEADEVDLSSMGLTKPLVESLKNGIDSGDLANTPVDVWIAKDSQLFTQFVFTTTVDDVDMDVRLTFMDYNKPVMVEVPENPKPITELLAPFLSLMQ